MELDEKELSFIKAYFVEGSTYRYMEQNLGWTTQEIRALNEKTKSTEVVDEIKKLKSQYYGIRKRSNYDCWPRFEDFYNWYIKQEKTCYYCKSTIEQVSSYLATQMENEGHKRDNRGWSFEVDRLNHNSKYFDDEVALSCYICNNAKSDVFEENEFTPIGKTIGKVIRGEK